MALTIAIEIMLLEVFERPNAIFLMPLVPKAGRELKLDRGSGNFQERVV